MSGKLKTLDWGDCALSTAERRSPNREAVAPNGPAIAGGKIWVRPLQNVFLLLAMSGIVYYFAHDFEQRERGTDFPDFYAAARMVREGYGHQLYDFQAQEQFQARYAGRTGDYYIHPPFETLLFLPLSIWSLQTAYLLWCILNVAVLAYTAVLFQRHVFKGLGWRVLLPLFFLFPPVLLSFMQGQDSLLLLLIMTLALVQLRRSRNFTAGCLLGCGLIKFHIILSVVALVASRRRKGLLPGFALVFVTLLLISAGIAGRGFLTEYPRFLMRLSSLPLAGIHPQAMANIRGLVSISGLAQNPAVGLVLIWMSSAFVFWCACRSIKSDQSEFEGVGSLAFGNFVLTAILISYHLSPPDLCIALLPLGLGAQYLAEHPGMPRWARLSLRGSQCVLFLPPLHLLSLARHEYVYPIVPILIMLVVTSAEIFGRIATNADRRPILSNGSPSSR